MPAEFEPLVDAILIDFGVTVQALLDIISGAAEPSGLLPAQMPANMKTVEEQFEDVPHDLACYVDAAGNIYDFAFGLNWQGVIQDERTKKYRRRRKNKTPCEHSVYREDSSGLPVFSFRIIKAFAEKV